MVYQSKTEGAVRGSYLLVLFENMSDPIVTGREELGFPKVWAEIPDPALETGTTSHTLVRIRLYLGLCCLTLPWQSWYGHQFLRIDLPELKAMKEDQDSQDAGQSAYGHRTSDCECGGSCLMSLDARTAGRNGILTHRHIPTVGRPGEHDASYAVYMPGNAEEPQ